MEIHSCFHFFVPNIVSPDWKVRKTMDKMKISIVTVCLNSVDTIAKTIESVLNQTYENLEYVIVDGVSTDGTLDVIKEYESNT